MSAASGRHFLQIPGPTNVPDRVLRAMDYPTIDHRGPDFQTLGKRVLENLRPVFKTEGQVIIFPSSGTGAWEAALVNTLSPGDRVLMYETGHFASLWLEMAGRLGLDAEFIAGDWRGGADAAAIEAHLAEDTGHTIKAVCVVHNETSTGATSDIKAVRDAIDRVAHPALLLVDTISSLGSIDYRHDEWGVDVTVAGSQKGLMLPPGLGFNAISEKAIAAAAANDIVLDSGSSGFLAWRTPIAGSRETASATPFSIAAGRASIDPNGSFAMGLDGDLGRLLAIDDSDIVLATGYAMGEGRIGLPRDIKMGPDWEVLAQSDELEFHDMVVALDRVHVVGTYGSGEEFLLAGLPSADTAFYTSFAIPTEGADTSIIRRSGDRAVINALGLQDSDVVMGGTVTGVSDFPTTLEGTPMGNGFVFISNASDP